jgi:uncharacterized protein
MPPSETIFSARPSVRFSGRLEERVTDRLVSLKLEEQEGGLTNVEIRLLNLVSNDEGSAELAFPDDEIIKLGAEVEVDLGPIDDGEPMFKGKVTAIEEHYGENPPHIVVLAEDALMQARMARRTHLYENTSISDLVQTVAGRLGLTGNTRGLSGEIPVALQLNESDLAFLRRMVEGKDGELQVVGRELQAGERSSLRRSEVELNVHTDIRRCRLLADLAHQVSVVTTSGWDEKQGQVVTASSAPQAMGPGMGRTGASWLDRALSRRSEHVAQPPVHTQAQADVLVNTVHTQRARRFVTLDATVTGNTEIRVGTQVRLRGTSARFDNTYLVSRAVHSYDLEAGYETSFEAGCAYLGEPS